jgi:hypothetical protein
MLFTFFLLRTPEYQGFSFFAIVFGESIVYLGFCFIDFLGDYLAVRIAWFLLFSISLFLAFSCRAYMSSMS